MNILIFSKCNLTSLGFELICNEALKSEEPQKKAVAKSYNDINTLANEVNSKEECLVLIDISLINYNDLYHFLNGINHDSIVIIICEKNIDMLTLPSVIHSILYKKNSVLKIAKEIYSIYTHSKKTTNKFKTPKLSAREKEILDLIVSGMSHQQIAEKLSINSKTVSHYRRNICRKHNVKNLNTYFMKSQNPMIE
ncbi:LuxR C-terminal-related transcriptional regulator [Yersinia vastinensis]|uniref:LuxR C-terminal-related transcriptional regulator n=1 Tax=Yersinia vastinensis TaxID=2890318 RepID=UPI0011A53A87|nr:LuxR family transcriptional regulator [Yersinia vastinensis]